MRDRLISAETWGKKERACEFPLIISRCHGWIYFGGMLIKSVPTNGCWLLAAGPTGLSEGRNRLRGAADRPGARDEGPGRLGLGRRASPVLRASAPCFSFACRVIEASTRTCLTQVTYAAAVLADPEPVRPSSLSCAIPWRLQLSSADVSYLCPQPSTSFPGHAQARIVRATKSLDGIASHTLVY